MPPSEEFHVNNASNIECLRLGFLSARNFVWLSLIPQNHRFKMFHDFWVKIRSFLTSSFQIIIKYPTIQKSQELHIFHFRQNYDIHIFAHITKNMNRVKKNADETTYFVS